MEKLWYYGKNYGTMEKTMVLWKKLWNFDLLWKNYGTMEKAIVYYSIFLLGLLDHYCIIELSTFTVI